MLLSECKPHKDFSVPLCETSYKHILISTQDGALSCQQSVHNADIDSPFSLRKVYLEAQLSLLVCSVSYAKLIVLKLFRNK